MSMKTMLLTTFFGSMSMFCSCRPEKLDSDILPQERMVELISDYQMAIALAQQGDSSIEKNIMRYKEAIFFKYRITEDEFNQSMAYYLRNPKEMSLIYEALKKRYNITGDLMANNNIPLNDSLAVGVYDSIDVWQYHDVNLEAKNQNYMIVRVGNLSQIKPYDKLLLTFDTNWLYRQGEKKLIATLLAKYANDSIENVTNSCYTLTRQTIELDIKQNIAIKNLEIQLLLHSTWQEYPQLLNISNISLKALRKRKEHSKTTTEPIKSDSNDVQNSSQSNIRFDSTNSSSTSTFSQRK